MYFWVSVFLWLHFLSWFSFFPGLICLFIFSFEGVNCCCSVTQSCLTLCNPMNCSMPGFPVLHHLLEPAQTHVHWVHDAIQPPCPMSSLLLPSIFYFKLYQMIKNMPAMQEIWVRSLAWEDPLEKGIATHSSIFAWRIPWAEEPSRLQSMASQSRTRLRD